MLLMIVIVGAREQSRWLEIDWKRSMSISTKRNNHGINVYD